MSRPRPHARDVVVSGLGVVSPYGAGVKAFWSGVAAGTCAIRPAALVDTEGFRSRLAAEIPDDVIARSRALDVPIYAISVVSPLDDPRSERFAGQERPAAATAGSALLARYSQQSGGAAFLVSDFSALRQAATQIVAELKHQYRLGYEPPDNPKHFRRIEVRSTRKGVVVRTRSGYVPPS